MSTVDYTVDGEVAVLTIDYPPVNSLNLKVRNGLGEALTRAEQDENVRAMVIVAAGKTFIAGADISEFGTPAKDEGYQLRQLQEMMERSTKLTVAGIHGTALGGGLEFALACSARVAVSSAMVGLPEVLLGLLPGAGGTQRLTRLVGPKLAIDLITTGKHIPAQRALELGVIDALVDDHRQGAIAFARDALASGLTFTPALMRTDKVGDVPEAFFETARKDVTRKARGANAPLAIVDCIEAACTLAPEEGLEFERSRFLPLRGSEQNKALTHVFYAERQARKVPGLPAGTAEMPIGRVAVIGSGTMGGGIAMVFANAGIPVTLLDVSTEALEKGRGTIAKNYAISVSRGSTPQAVADRALGHISTTTRYEDLDNVDLAIEAVFEKMELKQDIFAKLDRHTAPHAILATNTSSLDIDKIASATQRPEKVIGCHFFSPANVMKLLENVRGAKSSPETIATAMGLGKRLGKIVVLAGNTDGFIGNRMLQYYSGNAEFMMEQGATPEQIDRVAVAFGMPMGPPSMRDLTGMDVGVLVRRARAPTLPPGERFSPILERLYEAGRLGQKTGKGYYRYEGREKFADPETMAIIEQVSRDLGIKRRTFTDEEVRDGLFMPLVNEGAKEIEDGTALRASDVDVAFINGYGFPAYRGGPMYWGEQIGLSKIHDMAVRLERENGPRWAPSPLLTRLAREGKGWRDA